ncbi:unnamed protein product [Camellia sinensis]
MKSKAVRHRKAMADELYGIYISAYRTFFLRDFIADSSFRSPSFSLYRLYFPGITKNLEIMGDAIDLTGDGGVIKTIVRRAKPDAIAPTENLPLVDVHYEGRLVETDEVFDTTHEDNTIFTFELGKGNVIKGWDIALRTMKVGEVAKLTLKPEYAYGSTGSLPDIPPEPRKGSSLSSASDERARLEELKKQREIAAAMKEEEKKRREEAKAAAAARIQAKLESKKGQGKGKGKAK